MWTHDALAADLMDARHLAGEIAIERLALRGGIVDVAAMRLSWTHPRLTGYEVKVTRSDLLVDLRSEKWRNYLPCVQRLYFAISPDVTFTAEEIPPECGIMVRSRRHSWRTIRKAYPRTIDPDRRAGFVQALLFRHYPAVWDGPNRAHRSVMAAAQSLQKVTA